MLEKKTVMDKNDRKGLQNNSLYCLCLFVDVKETYHEDFWIEIMVGNVEKLRKILKAVRNAKKTAIPGSRFFKN